MTIALDRAQAVLAMHAAGVRQRQIAKRIGIARSTVQRILSGESPHELAGRVDPDADPDYADRPVRCEGCGGSVVLKRGETRCLACRLEGRPAVAEAACDVPTAQPRDVDVAELLDGIRIPLDLKTADRRRYEEVRSRRLESDLVGDGELDDIAAPTAGELSQIAAEEKCPTP